LPDTFFAVRQLPVVVLLELEEELLVLLDETLVTLDIGMEALPNCTCMSALPF
jgi:hypothetical protein